jgi:hypothetical protein
MTDCVTNPDQLGTALRVSFDEMKRNLFSAEILILHNIPLLR